MSVPKSLSLSASVNVVIVLSGFTRRDRKNETQLPRRHGGRHVARAALPSIGERARVGRRGRRRRMRPKTNRAHLFVAAAEERLDLHLAPGQARRDDRRCARGGAVFGFCGGEEERRRRR